jgi:ubiquinone/menaquinone biosynthesis C-methylase UbiE
MNHPVHSESPEDHEKYTQEMDKFYSAFAWIYDLGVKVFPVWKNWIKQVIPHIGGPRVLEVSFGTGYLLTQYADRFETFGIDYNEKLLAAALKNLERKGISAELRQGNVEALPYEDGFFDTVVNTMAFTGYPDGMKAMAELHRVLKPGGKLVMVDVHYPKDRNRPGMIMTRMWIALGDIIRDMDEYFQAFDFEYSDQEIGGFGSVHLYIARKK